MSARPLVLPAAGQDDVVDLDALVDEGGCGITRDLSIGVQTIAENTRKVPTIFGHVSSNFLKHSFNLRVENLLRILLETLAKL